MIETIVLGVEAGKGKYLVFAPKEHSIRLFVAFDTKYIGGHSDMQNELRMAAKTKEIYDAERFDERPEIIKAFNKTMKIGERIPQLNFTSSNNYKGGEYEFKSGILELFGGSNSFGKPSLEDLQEWEKNLLRYTNSEGNKIKEVKIEQDTSRRILL